ncbi:MAG: 3-isopropylmalate dehydratase small subunit, partial [Betaproteobacteria bacterium]|nr:3-isopropylmalate dehydratase small subunit [Betaproteobacteria bacterium]
NCFKNGLLPIRLDAEKVDALFKAVEANVGYRLKIDLEQQTISAPDGAIYKFEVEAFRKHCLLNGLDDIGLTLQHVGEIKAYEAKHRAEQPWLFA